MKPEAPDTIPVKDLYTDGNSYGIIAKCLKAARRAGWPEQLREAFRAEATSGDRDHLLQTVMHYFDEADEDDE